MEWIERSGRWLVLAVIVVTSAMLAGCSRPPYVAPSTGPEEGAFDILTIASCDSVGPGTFRFEPLATTAHTGPLFAWPWHPRPHALPPESVFHPSLRRLLGIYTGSSSESLTVLVSLVDRVKFPRLPEPFTRLDKTDSLNLIVQNTARDRIRNVIETRRPQYSLDSTYVVGHGGRILERFWITRALLVRIVRDSVGALGRYREVTYVQPELGARPPTFCPPKGDDPSDDVIEALNLIRTEPYRELQLAYGWVGLLDSGADDGHPVFGAARFAGKSDCVAGANLECEECCHCLEGSANDDSPEGHGTSSAALLSGGSTDCDGRFRGATDAQLNVFKVYNSGKLSLPATLRAIQCMAWSGDRIIVFETQDCSPDAAAMAVSADNLYDSGAIIVAAAGNLQNSLPQDVKDCDTRVGNPGASRRVMAVGARDIVDQTTPDYQSRGVVNGRIKPDIQAPTRTQTAVLTAKGERTLGSFGGTSGATPYAAAVAVYWRNWLVSHGKPFDPGQVYAFMILSGQTLGPYAATSETGAGLLKMPTNATGDYLKTSLDPLHDTENVHIDIQTPNDKRIEAAIWWPESLMMNPDGGGEMFDHSDVNLEILDPNGTVVASSSGAVGVFERTTASSLTTGRYTIRIHAQTLLVSPQTVYYASVVRHD